MLENKILRKMFVYKRDEVRREEKTAWRRVSWFVIVFEYNVKKNELIRVCDIYMWENRNVHRSLVGKPEGKRLHRRPRPRSKDNIKIHVKRQYGKAWTGIMLSGIGTCGEVFECGKESQSSIKFGKILDQIKNYIRLSRKTELQGVNYLYGWVTDWTESTKMI